MASTKRKVGIVGFGSLGKYLYNAIQTDPVASAALEVAFVWNRTPSKMEGVVPEALVCTNLDDFAAFGADVVVEVAHPAITASHGPKFIASADFFVGSPTAFADAGIEASVRDAAAASSFGVYVPSGALWGATDIHKMASRGSLKGLTITMKKHPSSLKVLGDLVAKLATAAATSDAETVLYDGPVRALCPMAPNNVNTMACAALAGHNLGFDRTQARLIADPRLEAHVIDIEVVGPTGPAGTFSVTTQRYNPAAVGAVTGNATYASFLSSLLAAGGHGPGFHFC